MSGQVHARSAVPTARAPNTLVRRLCNLDAVEMRTFSAPAKSRTGFWKGVFGVIFAVLYPRVRG